MWKFVETAYVKEQLERWIENHNKHHPVEDAVGSGFLSCKDNIQYGAVSYLAEHGPVSKSLISRIRNGKSLLTREDVADRLFCAMDRPDLMAGIPLYGQKDRINGTH